MFPEDILRNFKDGKLSLEETVSALRSDAADIGFAKIDFEREIRRGFGEVIYAAGKTDAQLLELFRKFRERKRDVLATRCSVEQAGFVSAEFPEITYDPVSRTAEYHASPNLAKSGSVAVCTGGTADIPVAEEAARTAEFFGAATSRFYDVGIAGIHRLFSCIDEIRKANVIIAAAGMEGALAGVIAGLVEVPVIAVPVSVGYGASFNGIAPLLTMLNSCAEGVSVVNIDNGFGAGYLAAQINRQTGKKK